LKRENKRNRYFILFLGELAQRLTRRLCDNCREEYLLPEDEFEMIRSDYGEEEIMGSGLDL